MNSADPKKVRTLDVRPLIAKGQEPFAQIIAAVAALRPGEGLAVVSPFLPSPLIERLQSEGFSARPERRGDGAWHTLFVPVPADGGNRSGLRDA